MMATRTRDEAAVQLLDRGDVLDVDLGDGGALLHGTTSSSFGSVAGLEHEARRRHARRRREMFRGLRADTVARLGQARYDEYDQLYAFFVGLVELGKLGGARFSATAGPGTS